MMAVAVAPAAATSAASSRKLPCSSTTRAPKRASRRRARARASRSRSTPSRRVPAPPSSKSRSACPPMPIVPSTTQPPRRGRKRNATSSIRTGRCACSARSSSSHTLRRQPRAHVVERADVVALEVRPAFRVPHLEHLLHADDQHVLHEARALAIVRRDLHASLRIEEDVLPHREIRIAKLARVGIEARQRGDFGLERLPFLERVHVEPAPVRHDHEVVPPLLGEHVAKARRNAETPYRVDRVPVMSSKHCLPRHSSPFRSTSWDFTPPGGHHPKGAR